MLYHSGRDPAGSDPGMSRDDHYFFPGSDNNFLVPDSPRTFIAIDMKSFYASVECVDRGLDPLKANLLVADESRSDQTICLAVSPALKAIGVPGRPRYHTDDHGR